ncbi:MAG TPA: hypothetical protein VD963_02325, partial [Phycisphaerales bacterium]|nr:hypothetical protein [Phycisphaerales bacterium]
MRPPRVALIATEPGTARARELLGRAFSRVRLEGGAPEVSLIPLAEAIAPNSGEQRLAEADLAVAYCPKRLAATDLYRLGAVLAAAGTPGLMLMDRPDEALARLHPGAVFVRGVRADAAGLAGLLEGLLGRQAALRALQAELRLANSLRSGTSAEIERLHEELLLAAHVQREFLPQGLPTLAGIDAAVLFRPTGFVSGDIYDLAMLDQHRLGFYLADAMGHGLSAALMTLFIAGNLHLRHPSRAGDPLPYRLVSPGTALARLNTALLGTHAGLGRMV